MNKRLKRTANILLKIVLSLVLLVVIIIILLQLPPVQNFARKKVVAFLETKLKTKVEVGRLHVSFPNSITLERIYVEDRQKDTLLYGGSIKADLNMFRLLRNRLQIYDLAIEGVTAKIKRQLPDTAFNFQFIVDAFVPTTPADTTSADSTLMQISLDELKLDNIRVIYQDVINGSDMNLWLTHLDSKIDKIDPYHSEYFVSEANLSGVSASIYQLKPLVDPDPLSEDIAEASAPIHLNLGFGNIGLDDISIDYRNDVSSFYSSIDIGKLVADAKLLDIPNRVIELDKLNLDEAMAIIKLGRAPGAKLVEQEVEQEIESQAQNPWRITVAALRLNSNDLKFDNDNAPHQPYGIDYGHIDAKDLTLHADNFIISNDTIGGRVIQGNFSEQSGFVLQNLQADFLYSNNETYLRDLFLQTPGTELKRSAGIRYASFKTMSNDIGNLQIEAIFDDSHVKVGDILAFAPQLRAQLLFSNPDETWWINGNISGRIADLHLQNLRLQGLQNTRLNVTGNISGLPDMNKLAGSLTIHAFTSSKSDVSRFVPAGSLPQNITLPDIVSLTGNLNGNAGAINGRLAINSSLGTATVTGTASNFSDPTRIKYNALINASNLQLGTILQNSETLGAVSASITARGTGFDPETAVAELNGNIHSVFINRYNYRDIDVKGKIANQQYNVSANINDPNIDIDADATGNLSQQGSLQFTTMVDSIKLHNLNLTPGTFIYRGHVAGNFSNIDPDNLQGEMLITRSLLVTQNERLPIDTITLLAGKTDTGQFIRLTSDVANAELTGQYKLSELGYVFQNNIQPYFSVSGSTATKAVSPYDFRFYTDINYTPLFASFIPGLTRSEPIHTEGRMATGQGLTASAITPFILFQGNELSNVNFKVNTNDSGMHFVANVDRLKSVGGFDLYQTRLTGTALDNEIDFNLNIHDRGANDKYNISGLLTQPAPGDISIRLSPDSLLLNYETWNIPSNNSISIINNQLVANNFSLQNGEQQLLLQSGQSAGNRPLDLRFTNFKIGTITGFLKADTALIDGTTNGVITFTDILKQPVFTSNLTIDDLSFRKDTLGNARIQVSSAGNTYNTNVVLTGRGNDLQVTGHFAPSGDDIALDLDLAIRSLQVSTMEGALADFVESATGSVNGNIAIKGSTSNPDVAGVLRFDSTSLTTKVLGGPLTINDETLRVTNEGFMFDNFSIRDSANNALSIDGTVLTSNFINYDFNLDVRARNFRALNTTKKQNDIYYGNLYLNTDLHIEGNEQTPSVTGSVTITEGTDFTFVMPQQEPGIEDREGVVEFVDFDAPENDSLFLVYDSLNRTFLTGFDVTANIEIEREAKLNIVVDEANGDFINLQGEAILSAGVDPSGNITLTGPYEIHSGAYQLSFNFLQRRFEIQPGSRIVWMGAPTDAQLDIVAFYEANTAPISLVEDVVPESERNYYLQKLPFVVTLNLEGEMMKPIISFDISLPEDRNYNVGGNVEHTVRQRLALIRREPSEINKQVFAVLLLNRFVGHNPFETGTDDAFSVRNFAKQSVSKLMTEQLNQLAAGLIEGVDLNFDVATADDYSTGEKRTRTDLSVGLSKRLMDDRLTVTVGSDFMLSGESSKQSGNNIAGDVSVTYQISKDGRYLLRFYRVNEYEGQVDGYVIETGLGFVMKVDYDRISEIFKNRKIRREQRRRTRNQTQQTDEVKTSQ